MTMRFGDCEVSLERLELRRMGEIVGVEPQVFEVLAYLLRHRDRVVPKTELLDTVWGSRFVSESALTSRIKSARRAVGDTGREQRIIKTIYGRGFRFVAEVVETAAVVEMAAVAQTPDVAGTSVVADRAGGADPASRVFRAVADAAAGIGAAIQVTGTARSGKRDLLQRVAALARRQPLAVGLSRAASSSPSPYSGVVAAVEEMVQRTPGLLDAVPVQCRGELERAFTGSLPSARQRLFVAVNELLAAAAERSGAVLLLDDLDLADREAVTLVEDVARLTRRCALVLVVAERADAVARSGFQVVPLAARDRAPADRPPRPDPPAEVIAARLADRAAPAARVADRLLAAGQPALAARYVLAAARDAAAAGLHERVLRWTEAVREHVDGPVRASVLALRADALAGVGDHGAVAAYRQAVAAADPEQAPGLRARLARAAILAGDLPSAQEALAGLSVSGGPDDGAILLGQGMLAYFSGDLDAATGAVESARALALRPGAPDRLLDVITLQGMIAHNRGEWFDRLRRELRATSENPQLAATVFDSHLCVAEYLLYGPTPYDEVIALADQLRGQAERAGARRGVAFAVTVAGEAALLGGDLDAARAYLTEAVRLHAEMAADTGTAHALQRLAELELAEGDRAAAERLLRRALPLARWSGLARHLLQRIYGTLISAAPSADAARLVVDEALERLDEPFACMFCQVMIAVPAAIACVEVGRLDEARSWLAQATRSAATWQGTAWQGAVTEARAHLARAEKDEGGAARLLAHAAELFGIAGQPLDRQRCLDALDGDALTGDALDGDALTGDALDGDALDGDALDGDALDGDR